MVGRHWLGIDIPASVQFDSMRIVMVTDAALMGLAIWDNFNQLRQARQSALQANLVQTAHNLELTRRLEDLEEQYDAAREIAEQKGRAYADTIHDLNQPLHALRLDLRRLARGSGMAAQGRARVEETLAYLERLVARQLQQAIEQEPAAAAEGDGPAIGIGETLAAIRDMFAADAAAKGIDLRLVSCTRSVPIEALVVMRIVTNLVSNAIKYTEEGRILIGCRLHGAALRVEVHDTDSGMTAAEFAAATARGVRRAAVQDCGAGGGAWAWPCDRLIAGARSRLCAVHAAAPVAGDERCPDPAGVSRPRGLVDAFRQTCCRDRPRADRTNRAPAA